MTGLPSRARKLSGNRKPTKSQPRAKSRRGFFEPLEDRNLLATIPFVVAAGQVGNQNFGGALGMDFNVGASPITVTSLGAFDDGSNGINGTINVRLYDRTNTAVPLASAAFTGTTQQLIGGSRFSPIAALTLPAGFQGRIIADGYNALELNGNGGPWTTDSGGGAITFGTTGFYALAPGGYTTNTDGGPGNRYAAGTFAFVPQTLTTTYANSAWSVLPVGSLVQDADPGTAGNQPAVVGIDAFATIQGAVNASAAGGTTVVNTGTYAETVTLAGTKSLEISGPAQAVTISALNTVAGQTLVLEGAAALTLGDASNLNSTIAGAISGAGSLTKAGGGLTQLSAANSYTGGTFVNAGTLRLTGGTPAPGNITVNGGVYSMQTNTFNGFDTTKTITLNAGGTMSADSTANNAYNIGPLVMNGGVLTSANGLAGPANDGGFGNWLFRGVTVGGSALSTINATQVAIVNGNFDVADVIAGPSADLLVSARIINSGPLSKIGAGTMQLTAVNTFTTATTIGAGTLQIAGAGSLASGTYVGAITNNGILEYSSTAAQTLSGNIGGTGALVKDVATSTLLLSGTNTYGGTTTVTTGVLQLQNGSAISNTGGAVSVALGATLQLLASETISSYLGAGDGVGSNDSLLALGANTLTTTGSAAIANVTAAAGGGIVAGTNIVDNDDDNNVTAPNIFLQAGTGIGTAVDPIETAVANIQLSNTTSGVVNVLNSNGGAILTVSDLRALTFASRNLGGATTIVNSSPLTIAANVISAGAIVLTATDSAGAGDNLIVNAGVTIQSTGSTVTLNAGDNATIPATSLLAAAGTVTVNIDAGNADPGVGGSLVFDGDIDAPGAVFNGVGDTNGDSFDVRPDQDVGDVLTPITVNGLAPVSGAFPVGDRLIVDIAGLGIPTLTLGAARSGSFSFGALAAALTYTDIESVVSDPPGSAYHLVLDMKFSGFQNGVADTINAQLNPAGTDLLLDVNGSNVFTGAVASIQSLTVIGSSDNDSFTIQQTAGGLPSFKSAAPAVNNTGIGGGVSAGSHLNTSADNVLETLVPGGTPWDANDVTIHFDGGAAGTDTVTLNQTTGTLTGYFSDTNDAGNSGNLIAPFKPFLFSFANVEPLVLTGPGSLITDATSTPATANLTLTDIGPATQIVGDGGFAATTFSGFTDVLVAGGNGSENIDLVSVDNATLTLVRLAGGNTNDLLAQPGGDTAADTIRLRSLPATIQALLAGYAGSDNFLLSDAGNSVDNIAGNVTVDGTDGNVGGNADTLSIVNTGSANADNALVGAVNPGVSQDYFVDGVTSNVSTDVVFRNIDVLNYTGTTFADAIEARLVNTTPTHDLSTVNLSGWTGADQFLLFTSDQRGGSGVNNTPTGTPSGVSNVNLYGDAPGNPNAGDSSDTFGQTPIGIVGTGANNVGLVVPDSTRMIRPSGSTAIAIDGGQPTGLAAPLGDVAGDVLNVDISALPNTTPVVVSTFSPGTVVATGISPLTWTQIEDINVVDQGLLTNVQMGDLFARTTPNADLIQLTANPVAGNPNQVRLRLTSTIGNYSASNKTIIYAGAGNDTLTQSNLTIPAEFYGEAGDDYLTGAMNNDWLVGGTENDRINGSGGNNIIWGDNAPTTSDPNPQDALTGGNDQLSGLSGNDVFYGSGGNDTVSGGAGNDYASGGAGDDSLDGNDGDDRLYGGAGNDLIGGQAGNDLLSGGDGADRLYGGSGSDVVLGGNGTDQLDGGDGNDLIIGAIVAGETSSRTSVANTTTFSQATYTNGLDNDAALLTLLTQWSATNDSSSIGAITHDHVKDELFGGSGEDDFCWETIDVSPGLAPSDFAAGDQRIPPNA